MKKHPRPVRPTGIAAAVAAVLISCAAAPVLAQSAPAGEDPPAAGDDATRSFREKRLVKIQTPDTIADGARTTSLGSITFPLVMNYVNDMLTVTDEELLRTMFWLWERMKIVVEPTGALAACALLEKKLNLEKQKVGVILSGGNVDLRWAASKVHEGQQRGAH